MASGHQEGSAGTGELVWESVHLLAAPPHLPDPTLRLCRLDPVSATGSTHRSNNVTITGAREWARGHSPRLISQILIPPWASRPERLLSAPGERVSRVQAAREESACFVAPRVSPGRPLGTTRPLRHSPTAQGGRTCSKYKDPTELRHCPVGD